MRFTILSFAVLLALSLVLGGCSGTDESNNSTEGTGPAVAKAGAVRLDEHHTLGEPVVAANLTVWPVYTDAPLDLGEFLTLQEAIEKGVAEVREKGGGGQQRDADMNQAGIDAAEPQQDEGQVLITENGQPEQILGGGAEVGTLVVENKGDLPILVCAGTIVKGGQQDRQIGQDFVIPQAKAVPVDAFCVEKGRWVTARMGRQTDGKFVAGMMNAVPAVRAPAQYLGDQGEVWEEVAKVKATTLKNVQRGELSEAVPNAAFAADSSSLAVMLDANKEVSKEDLEKLAKAVKEHFAKAGQPVGFAYSVDGKPVNVRVFAHHRIFEGQFEPFVNTMCAEAFLAGLMRKDKAAPPPAKAEDVVALVREIEAAAEEMQKTSAGNLNGVRKAAAGFNGNCYLTEGEKRVAVTRDWTRK